MLFITLQTLTVVLAGLMVGNELAVAVFVHPQLCSLEDRVHTASAQALARIYGKVMPFWYTLTLVLTISIAFLLWQTQSISLGLAITSAVLWFLSILLTLTRLVPINDQVSRWDLDSLPSNWQNQRNQWDRFHSLRVLILILALICLTTACLIAPGFTA